MATDFMAVPELTRGKVGRSGRNRAHAPLVGRPPPAGKVSQAPQPAGHRARAPGGLLQARAPAPLMLVRVLGCARQLLAALFRRLWTTPDYAAVYQSLRSAQCSPSATNSARMNSFPE